MIDIQQETTKPQYEAQCESMKNYRYNNTDGDTLSQRETDIVLEMLWALLMDKHQSFSDTIRMLDNTKQNHVLLHLYKHKMGHFTNLSRVLKFIENIKNDGQYHHFVTLKRMMANRQFADIRTQLLVYCIQSLQSPEQPYV